MLTLSCRKVNPRGGTISRTSTVQSKLRIKLQTVELSACVYNPAASATAGEGVQKLQQPQMNHILDIIPQPVPECLHSEFYNFIGAKDDGDGYDN